MIIFCPKNEIRDTLVKFSWIGLPFFVFRQNICLILDYYKYHQSIWIFLVIFIENLKVSINIVTVVKFEPQNIERSFNFYRIQVSNGRWLQHDLTEDSD